MNIVHFGSFTTRRPCGVANAGAMIGANAVVTKDIPSGAKAVGANRLLTAQS
jgi:acetyltransferase-like isoleucine patch superfamily enzyme